ncbi:MAG: ABC transporter ATP-binding protein, partial [Miltoncostaeaceae bacterium]
AAAVAAASRGHQSESELLLLFADDAAALAAALRDTGLATDIRATRQTGLEDVFLMLTGRRLRELS